MKKSLAYGIVSSMFFAFTFVLNRSMNVGGGSYMWSSALRFIFMLPILFVILIGTKSLKKVLTQIGENKLKWFIWSIVGFGVFYLPLTIAASYGQSWLVAGTWQIAMVTGPLLSPLFGMKIPIKNLVMSMIVLAGVGLIQYDQAVNVSVSNAIYCVIFVIIAAVAYPLGNRKMMQICDGKLNTTERVFGMTLCSMPFWAIVCTYGYIDAGLPSKSQVMQSILVAVFSGVIATILYFKATDLVKHNPGQLAVAEATISGEVIFTLIGGVLFIGDTMPSIMGLIGLIVIVVGMILNSIVASKQK